LTFRVYISHCSGRPLAEIAYESIKSQVIAQRVPCQVLEDMAEPPIRHYRDCFSCILPIPCEVAIALFDPCQTLDFNNALTFPREVSEIIISTKVNRIYTDCEVSSRIQYDIQSCAIDG
jgi:hypothetical protein